MEPYQQLEIEWAEFNGLDPAGMVACSSGTAALHLALEALQLPQGSEVIVPDYTMVACARAVTLAGLTPVFVDCDERLLMDVVRLTGVGFNWSKVGAVMLVHIYGRRCDDDWWDHWAVHQGVKVIEDLAEAHGARPHPRTDAACWSFYRNKIVAGEEGGAVWFRNPEHARLAKQLRSLGFTDAHDFQHVPRGHNYRMSNLHAEMILGTLRRNWGALCHYKENMVERRQIEEWYDAACPAEWRMPPRDAPWVYDLRVPGMTRVRMGEVVRALNDVGISARHGFWPMSMQKEYGRYRFISNEPCRSWKVTSEVFYLPIQPGVTTEEDARLAFEVIKRTLG